MEGEHSSAREQERALSWEYASYAWRAARAWREAELGRGHREGGDTRYPGRWEMGDEIK